MNNEKKHISMFDVIMILLKQRNDIFYIFHFIQRTSSKVSSIYDILKVENSNIETIGSWASSSPPPRLHRHILRWQNHDKAQITHVMDEISRVVAIIAHVAAKSGI